MSLSHGNRRALLASTVAPAVPSGLTTPVVQFDVDQLGGVSDGVTGTVTTALNPGDVVYLAMNVNGGYGGFAITGASYQSDGTTAIANTFVQQVHDFQNSSLFTYYSMRCVITNAIPVGGKITITNAGSSVAGKHLSCVSFTGATNGFDQFVEGGVSNGPSSVTTSGVLAHANSMAVAMISTRGGSSDTFTQFNGFTVLTDATNTGGVDARLQIAYKNITGSTAAVVYRVDTTNPHDTGTDLSIFGGA